MTLQGIFNGRYSRGQLILNTGDGNVVQYDCNFDPPVSIPFNGMATSEGNIDQCLGSCSFSGVIGPNDFTLNFSNDLTVQGVLNSPVPEEYSVNGNGNWTFN